ncbi:MAG: hypothetical protein K2O01_01900 [Bacteroidales bacterium]|nr:hypothetical protein [Bacteroidales bacterium]
MKRITYKLLCISSALCISPTLFAQEAYYYYDGEKVPLEVNHNKVSILTPKNGNTADKVFASKQSSYDYEYTIQDNRFEHMVVNLASWSSAQNKNGMVALTKRPIDEEAIVLPIYQDEQFEELVLTNSLYVRLKQEQDGFLLDSIAKVYKLDIVDTNEWMPLWHTLSITPQSQGSSLDIANAIFETGLFASAFPDFAFDMIESASTTDELSWGIE